MAVIVVDDSDEKKSIQERKEDVQDTDWLGDTHQLCGWASERQQLRCHLCSDLQGGELEVMDKVLATGTYVSACISSQGLLMLLAMLVESEVSFTAPFQD